MRVPTCVLSSFEAPRVLHGHSPDLFVQIGSLTKPLTATVLTRLADSGFLGLDDPLESFLPAPRGTGITLRHLAEHTSGLPRLPPGLGGSDPYAAFDAGALDSVVRHLDGLVTAPAGTSEEYSNLGYAVLGAALVSAAGASYEELLSRHVLDPLGVTDVRADPPADRRLHRWGPLELLRRPWTMTGAILPAGGLWATPRAAARVVVGLLVDRGLGDPAPAWQPAGPMLWHNGATNTASVFAGASPSGWILVHRQTGRADATDKLAVDTFKAAVAQRRR
ncbi:serine hydrolase domain-containing protein [Streptomyces olivochromogenes]|uniref:serine hydrolase domain-containing protein n=1 Tax=Streptomyces olivochromogenes TaxID=1963 RepID=UPI001F191C25|nr:serine hydrolase domain-containing protein [Streptomyces olivochromogenes]MCF3129516.1 beta-lactamase family protein [Streptomyces olivochromogenes]